MVLAVALVVGVLLLGSWGNDSGTTKTDTGAGSPATTADLAATTTAAEGTTTTLGGAERAPTEVSVIVLNGSGKSGVAAGTSATIGETGYVMQEAANAPAQIPSTVVYYADGYQSDAIAVANLLGLGTDVVQPLTSASLGGAEGDADVVVVLGQDTTAAAGTTTTTTA
jgi:LytR cell envelope-related transcriptional attenuator